MDTRKIFALVPQFFIGLFKKVVIADTLGEFVDPVFSDASFGCTVTSLDAWLAMICFALQIYFDFSGYSIWQLTSKNGGA